MDILIHLVDGMAAPDDQSLAGEQIGFGIEMVIHREDILGSLVMTVLQTLFADGDELAFVAGSAAALGEPIDRSVPEDILFSVHDTLDIWLQVVVLVNGYRLFEVAQGEGFGEIVFAAKLSILGGSDEML